MSFTDRGEDLARRVRETALFETNHERCGGGRLKEAVSAAFRTGDAVLFIGAAGIAVRAIAPLVKSKLTDPAVLVADESGKFIIPILSGHIGGANDLALLLAEHLDMIPVITTATDVNGVLAVDSWAVKQGLRIENPEKIKEVSMKVLRGETLNVECDIPWIFGEIPPVFSFSRENPASVRIGVSDYPDALRGQALRLTPKLLHVGIGCRRGTSSEAVADLFDDVFASLHLSRNAVAEIASIDLKADEAGLLRFCRDRGYPVRFFSGEQLRDLKREYAFSVSDFVKGVTGVESVCERAAVKSAETADEIDGRNEAVGLLLKKTSKNGVTVAVATYLSIIDALSHRNPVPQESCGARIAEEESQS